MEKELDEAKSVAVSMTDIASQNTYIWTYDLQGASARRLTFDPSADSVPIWSPDASRLLFASNRLSFNDLYVKDSDGAQEEKSLMHDDIDKFPNDWSRDGNTSFTRITRTCGS